MFTKAFWLTLLSRSQSFVDASHPHIQLLKEFLDGPAMRKRSLDGQENAIEFAEFIPFLQGKGITRDDLLKDKAARLFSMLDEPFPTKTRYCTSDGHALIYHFKNENLTGLLSIDIDFERYAYVKEIGHGANGVARLYRNEAGKCIVVKSPLIIPNKTMYQSHVREIQIRQALYPQDGLYFINHKTGEEKQDNYNFYTISPYISGTNLGTFCSELKTAAELIETLIAVTDELQRIHSLSIIHGDISADNVRVWRDPYTNRLQVRYFDFEWAYFLNEPMRLTVIPDDHRWAPERNILNYPQLLTHSPLAESFELSITPPKADPSQDVFSYGDMLREILTSCKHINVPLNIKSIVQHCKMDEADKRPLLESVLREFYKAESLLDLTSTAQFMKLGIAKKMLPVCENFYSKEREVANDQHKQVTDDDFVITVGNVREPLTTSPNHPTYKNRCIIM